MTAGRRAVAAFCGDLAAVLGFVVLGRRSHSESLAGALVVAAPFAIALIAGWLVARAHRDPVAPRTGLVVWGVTAVLGLALRGMVFGRGLAPAFVVVALVTLCVLIVGWRVVAVGPRRRRPAEVAR